MTIEREEETTIIERAQCDYCGKLSRPLKTDSLPRGWVTHTVKRDWEKFFEENPGMRGVTGWFPPFSTYHFCRHKHFELWLKLPKDSTKKMYVATLKDEFK